MDLSGSNTEKNLYRTFAGESRVKNKYNLYAEKARQEGLQWVAAIFEETAENEKAHARRIWGDFLNLICSTKDNIKDSIMGEANKYKNLYRQYEKEAREEGFEEIANFYEELAQAEEAHEKRFKVIYDKLEKNTLFKGDSDSKWCCMNCGCIHEGMKAPVVCPLCKYPRAYFKAYCDISD